MKTKELMRLGFNGGEVLWIAREAADAAAEAGMKKSAVRELLRDLASEPVRFAAHPIFGAVARHLTGGEEEKPVKQAREGPVPYKRWGENLDAESIRQMENACRLPVSVAGAIMPDAHVGYGLPIGGVLATDNAVIPYAVGVDIACRMKMSVLDLPPETLERDADRLKRAIENETRFGIGAEFKNRRAHDVMDDDWSKSPVTKRLKDKAWAQLGTSGSGNHFVEFGILEIGGAGLSIPAGRYLALLSHSGSRGAGAEVAGHYSRIARAMHPELPKELHHLAWLSLDTREGREYWLAMELMGCYAAANHACIHRHVTRALGAEVMLDIENHHNFAWRERHFGRDVIVHRKGATPAGIGMIGIIPGSMASPCYIVRGKGNPDSLSSAAHGAGRVMSRKKAMETFNWTVGKQVLARENVTLISAGLDELPMSYKDIREVMRAQSDLVETLAVFHPRLVKMAPSGERPED